MSLLPLTMAAVDYDRFRALHDGRVRPEGIDLNILPMPVEEIFYRQIKFAEFEVSEMSLSSYVLTLDRDDPPFIAVPVFPSRYFRHQTMFINAHSGISSPSELKGKRIGVPEFQITAGVWQRGILHDDYNVAVSDMHYFSGGVDAPGRTEKQTITLPDGVKVEAIAEEQTLSQMLSAGEIDAIFSAHVPSCFYTDNNVQRLFPDYKAVEKEYFARTRIFPIMHVLVVRRPVFDQHPWVAASLVKACQQSLEIARSDLMYRSSLKVMLPWLADHVDETVDALGEEFWSYGLKENYHVLDTFLRYLHEQGLAQRQWRPEDIFAKNTTSSFVI